MKRKQMAVRLEEDQHKEVMKMLIDEDRKFQEYIINLISEDMFKKGYNKIKKDGK